MVQLRLYAGAQTHRPARVLADNGVVRSWAVIISAVPVRVVFDAEEDLAAFGKIVMRQNLSCRDRYGNATAIAVAQTHVGSDS